MNLLQLFFIISGVVIFILALDIAKREKFNALHFLIFLGIGGGLLVFTFFPTVLDKIGNVVGLQRGADALVYGAIIFLLYFALLLLRKVEHNKEDITRLVREIALNNSKKTVITGKEVFIVPSYNEGEVIYDTLNSILKDGYKNIIVVDDGSRDDTQLKLSKLSDKITILRHYKNRGQGAALETGFEYVRRFCDVEYVISFDADGQHSLEDLEKFIDTLDKDSLIQIAFGSRFLDKRSTTIPMMRRVILKLGVLFTFFLSHIKLTDTHNGYRVMRQELLSKLSVTMDGMGHASEIIDFVSKHKVKFVEIPVEIKYTDYSMQKGQSSGNAIAIALRFIWNKFFR
ncbi:DUF2304 family protein [Candidatus Gracilibacteria bacterium]|nr:DUF2304 family protein [Candidatus Gracilibacteria bacterium]